jgi:hypothetical protein
MKTAGSGTVWLRQAVDIWKTSGGRIPVNRSRCRLLCILIVAGFLVAGLWPFNFHPRNRLEWLSNENGIHLGPLSVSRSLSVLDLGKPKTYAASSGAVTLELLLEAEHEPTGNISTLLSLYGGDVPENLLIAQWKSAFLMRSAVSDPQGHRRYRETDIDSVLQNGKRRFIAVTSGPEGISFYVDGNRAEAYPKTRLRPEVLRGQLILGDSARGNSRWSGKIFGLAAFASALPAMEIRRHHELWSRGQAKELGSENEVTALYFFDEKSGPTIHDSSPWQNTLIIPQSYAVSRKTILSSSWVEWLNWQDVAVNILGFIPFGFLYYIYRMMPRPERCLYNFFLVVAAGLVISAAIELAQVFLPTRDSSFSDLICNTFGTALGVILARGLRMA